MKISLFIKNTVILSAYGVILRLIGMVFRVVLVNRIGAECTGLYQLIFSVYMLLTGAVNAGMSMAVTRAVSEISVRGSKYDVKKVLRRAVTMAASVSAVIAVCTFLMSYDIALLIGDIRAQSAIKILVFSLPMMSVSACYKGYFSAVENTIAPSNTQLIEQIVRIAVVGALLVNFANLDIGATCAVILLGDCIAEAVSCAMIYILYRRNLKKMQFSDTPVKLKVGLLRVAFPVGFNRLSTSVLRTVENLLIPNTLGAYYMSKSVALAQFGIIRGMALPILLFPSSILGSVSSLLVPELTRACAQKNILKIKICVERVVKITLCFSVIAAFAFHLCADELGAIIYNSSEVTKVITLLSAIVPMMYLDLLCDGILKGLDCQLYSMICSIADSVLRIVLILLIVPKYGIYGFIGIMIFSNIFTCVLSMIKLRSVAHPEIDVFDCIIVPMLVGGLIWISGNVISSFTDDNVFALAIKLAVTAIFGGIYMKKRIICGVLC